MKTQPVDLHSHSVHSDGTFTVAELLDLAREKGVRALALTDHDTTAGLDEALALAGERGLEVIPGIEISVLYDPGTMHILGYFFDPKSGNLQAALDGFQEARRQRNPQIIERLKAVGVAVTMEEVIAESGGGQLGRPHFARALVKKGYCRDFEEAFKKYLGKGASAYVDKRRFTPEEGIRMIRDAGGLPVLAHPKLIRARDDREFGRLLDQLVKAGLAGIEAYSSCQDEQEARQFRAAGEARNIFVTGGSDFHGANKPEVKLGEMGDWAQLKYELVEKMRAAAGPSPQVRRRPGGGEAVKGNGPVR